MKLVRLDAHELPFRTECFDVILLYEAIYYLDKPECFLQECRRILRSGGTVLICTANREWSDFNPSPFSTRYFSAAELSDLLQQFGFHVEVRGACPVAAETARDRIVSIVKHLAVRFHLIPKTMKGKEFLKRVFLGRLVTMPFEVPEEPASHTSFGKAISDNSPASRFKVLYLSGRLGLK
jgi:SAM-dependent methyltransferase